MTNELLRHQTLISKRGEYDADSLIDLATWQSRVPGHYVEGVVRLWVNGIQLIEDDMWTDVQDLWGYFVNACEEILEAPVASFFWPDAPIPVRFERDGPRRLTVTVDNRKVSVDRVRFVAELCEAGAEVFDQLAAITSRREYQLEQAQRARAIAQRAKSQSSS